MPAQIGRFSRELGSGCSPIVAPGPSARSAFRHHPQKRTSVRSHRNPVPSWHYTNGRAGWREGS